jgi:hypothetical protein
MRAYFFSRSDAIKQVRRPAIETAAGRPALPSISFTSLRAIARFNADAKVPDLQLAFTWLSGAVGRRPEADEEVSPATLELSQELAQLWSCLSTNR